MSADLSLGIEEQAALIRWFVGVWHDLGYPEPLPFPTAHPIPPMGERSAECIKGAHAAIEEIDKLTRQLYRLREQLAGELRQNEDALMARLDARYGPLPRPNSDRPLLHLNKAQLAARVATGDAEAVREDAIRDGGQREDVAEIARRRGRVELRPGEQSCGCPVDDGLVRHARATCTDPVVARLGWYFDGQERQS